MPAVTFTVCRSAEGDENMGQDKPATDDLLAQVVEACGLVQYQQGAIVSRTLIKKPTGTVTLFAFDKGQELSEHTAPFDALAHVLDGETEITISGKPLQLAAGQMVLMPANQPHAVRATARFKMMLVMVRG
jgi:quercetin dioxygenase-like cupin family protein